MTAPLLGPGGWAIPDNERISHYFVGATSLCHRWRYGGSTSPAPRPAGNHCRICAQEAEKR